MTTNITELKNNVLSFRVEARKAINTNKTPYEKARLNVLAQLERAWNRYNENQQQDWFTKGDLDSSQVYFTIRYGKQPVIKKFPVPKLNLADLYPQVREAIKQDAFKDEILAAQAEHSAAMRGEGKAAKARKDKEAAKAEKANQAEQPIAA